jgi:spatacsin
VQCKLTRTSVNGFIFRSRCHPTRKAQRSSDYQIVTLCRYKRLYLAAQLSTPELPLDDRCTDQSLLEALAAVGKWDEARRLAQQGNHSDQTPSPETTSSPQVNPNHLVQSMSREEEPSGRRQVLGGGLLDYVTLLQAEALLAEWRELLWDDPAERLAIWGHCSALFEKHGFPARRAGDFFLHHAEQLRLGDPPAPSLELHTVLLLAVQWLSGSFSGGPPAASGAELAALEAELWMAAIDADREAEAGPESGEGAGLIPQQAQGALRATAEVWPAIVSRGGESKRAGPSGVQSNRDVANRAREVSKKEIMGVENTQDLEIVELHKPMLTESRSAADASAAVSALLEDGRLSAARGLLRQLNLTPSNDFQLVQAAEIVAAEGTAALPPQLATFLVEQGLHLQGSSRTRQESRTERADALRQIGDLCSADGGRGHILRLAAVCQAAAALSLGYREAGKTTPLELMQLLALQAGRSGALDAARQMGIAYEGRGELPSRKVARVLAECFQKGLVAAHKGGYLEDGPADEAGPAPLLWRPADFVQVGGSACSDGDTGSGKQRGAGYCFGCVWTDPLTGGNFLQRGASWSSATSEGKRTQVVQFWIRKTMMKFEAFSSAVYS